MNKKIGKYRYNNEEEALTNINALNENDAIAIVKLGHVIVTPAEIATDGTIITPATLSEDYHVDVLWNGLQSHPEGWEQFAIDPTNPIHLFAGISY